MASPVQRVNEGILHLSSSCRVTQLDWIHLDLRHLRLVEAFASLPALKYIRRSFLSHPCSQGGHMQRFLMWIPGLVMVLGVGLAAQGKIATLEDHAKIMKANAQANGGVNKAVGSGSFADARMQVMTLRQNFMTLQAFYTEKKKDDAVTILKDGLSRLDAIDKLLAAPAPDAMAVQAAMKEFGGNTCGACHKLYREGDAQTGFKFKAGSGL